MRQLWELTEFALDGQRQAYTVSQITTMVGFAIATGGGNTAVKGASKGSDVLGEFAGLADKLGNCPKLFKYFDDIKKVGKDLDAEFKKLKELTDAIDPGKLEKALRYIGKSEVDDIISKLHKLRELDGIDKIVADLGHESYTKFLGSRFVLDYASKLDGALISAKKIIFEVPETFSFGGKEVDRFYDIVEDGIRKELKAWNTWKSWSDDVIRKQFVRDLANPSLEKIEGLKWIFKKTDGITDIGTLKSKVINALKSDLSRIEDTFDEKMVKKLFPSDELIDEVNYAERLISNLEKAENFSKVFKVVE